MNNGILTLQESLNFILIQRIKRKSSINKIKSVINKGADVNTTIFYYITPLMMAIQIGYIEVIPLLIDCGANILKRIYQNYTAIHMAVFYYIDKKILSLLFLYNPDIDAQEDQFTTPLMMSLGNIECFSLLLNKGANVHLKDINGYTVLMHAVQSLNTDAVRLLLKHGSDIFDKCNKGTSSLDIALQNYKYREKHVMEIRKILKPNVNLLVFQICKNKNVPDTLVETISKYLI